MRAEIIEAARKAYASAGSGAITLGAVLDGAECHPEPIVQMPLAMLNRHGLIAGATGTGKTRTLQLVAEQLSRAGVPVFLSDVKGDLSGVGASPACLTIASHSASRTPASSGIRPRFPWSS